jgi:polygalacturonase
MVSLRDNIELYLERGAVLNSILEPVPQPGGSELTTTNTKRYLLGGIGVRNVSITGHGVIDGRGYEKFWDIDPGREYRLWLDRYFPKPYRPKGLIHFRESSGITIRDVTILSPPAYGIWLLGCDFVSLDSIKINSDPLSPNTDGLDIDCCANVNIINCDIDTGDDAIALKSDTHELGCDKACENVTVSNCRLKTTSCGIRLGYEGDGAIRNCIFTNCVIYESMIGISMMVTINPDGKRVRIFRGPEISGVIFSNLVINAMQTFNFQVLREGPGEFTGYIDNIMFQNIIANATRGSYIGGLAENHIRSLDFENLSMTLNGHLGNDFADSVPEPYPIWNDLSWSGIPWAVYARHVEELRLRNIKFNWDKAENWKGDLQTFEVARYSNN